MYEKLLTSTSMKSLNRNMGKLNEQYAALLPQDEKVSDRLEMTDMGLANQSYYLRTWAGFPVYQNTDLNFYSEPVKLLEAIEEELKKARKYIFIECHVMEESVIWKGIEMILREKAEQGVDVRVLYDATGTKKFPHDRFTDHLRKRNIKCKIFNKRKAVFRNILNYSDYRKVLTIDGRCAFTGDFDLTNDQFSLSRDSHAWKISGLQMSGDAVRSMTYGFLKMWNATEETPEDPIPYLLKTAYRSAESGFAQPFTTNLVETEKTGKNAYLNMIRNARKYLYLTIPEKLTDQELRSELLAAAKRGVRIYIILPDGKKKKKNHPSWDSEDLIRMFVYTAGKLQARQIVSDDQVAIVGNTHMDAAHMKRNFECGCWIACSRSVLSVKRDFEKMLPYCEELTGKKE